jgi:hypothetical protein
MRGKKAQDPKKNGTLRPWLVDVVVEGLRSREKDPWP